MSFVVVNIDMLELSLNHVNIYTMVYACGEGVTIIYWIGNNLGKMEMENTIYDKMSILGTYTILDHKTM